MKKLVVIAALLIASASSFAQQRELPRFAHPQSDADKVLVDRAIARTDAMSKQLNFPEDKWETVLEINLGSARMIEKQRLSDNPNKEEAIRQLKERRLQNLSTYLGAETFHRYVSEMKSDQE